jgi:hypothetical protein
MSLRSRCASLRRKEWVFLFPLPTTYHVSARARLGDVVGYLRDAPNGADHCKRGSSPSCRKAKPFSPQRTRRNTEEKPRGRLRSGDLVIARDPVIGKTKTQTRRRGDAENSQNRKPAHSRGRLRHTVRGLRQFSPFDSRLCHPFDCAEDSGLRPIARPMTS